MWCWADRNEVFDVCDRGNEGSGDEAEDESSRGGRVRETGGQHTCNLFVVFEVKLELIEGGKDDVTQRKARSMPGTQQQPTSLMLPPLSDCHGAAKQALSCVPAHTDTAGFVSNAVSIKN